MSYHAIDCIQTRLRQQVNTNYFINEDINELRSMISDLQHEVKILTEKLFNHHLCQCDNCEKKVKSNNF